MSKNLYNTGYVSYGRIKKELDTASKSLDYNALSAQPTNCNTLGNHFHGHLSFDAHSDTDDILHHLTGGAIREPKESPSLTDVVAMKTCPLASCRCCPRPTG
jgi:hypothetical protein